MRADTNVCDNAVPYRYRRLVCEQMNESTFQSIIVENVPCGVRRKMSNNAQQKVLFVIDSYDDYGLLN